MIAWQVALLTLAALLVGLLIPLLLQARAALKQVERQLSATGQRVIPILEDAQSIAHRVQIITESLEGREHRIGEVVETAGEVAGTVQKFSGATRAATMVGGAVAAAVKAYREVSIGAEPAELSLEEMAAREAEAAEHGAEAAEREAGAAARDAERAEAAASANARVGDQHARTANEEAA